MIAFDLWIESFIFFSIYSVIIIVPCVLVALLGRKMIDQMGQYPTQAPVIQMGVLFKLVIIETVTFISLITFYNVFAV